MKPRRADHRRDIEAVILDVDGTLLDSNDAHAAAFVQAMETAGFSAPFERVRRLIGMGSDKLLPQAIGVEAESEEGRRIDHAKGELFKKKYLPRLRPTRGAPQLVARLTDEGIRLAVASSADGDVLQSLLEKAGVDRFIDVKTSSDDAARSKPDPDIVKVALHRTGADPRAVWMIGDTPYDIEAAHRAGIHIVALRCGGWNSDELGGADAVYADPADLLQQFESSPLATLHAPSRGRADGD